MAEIKLVKGLRSWYFIYNQIVIKYSLFHYYLVCLLNTTECMNTLIDGIDYVHKICSRRRAAPVLGAVSYLINKLICFMFMFKINGLVPNGIMLQGLSRGRREQS